MEIMKIILKVNLNCQRCKTEYMKVVSKLEGVNEISMADGKLVVVGTVDPVDVVNHLRKAKKFAEVISIGPNNPPAAPTPTPAPTPPPAPLPACCRQCQIVSVSYDSYGGCSVM